MGMAGQGRGAHVTPFAPTHTTYEPNTRPARTVCPASALSLHALSAIFFRSMDLGPRITPEAVSSTCTQP